VLIAHDVTLSHKLLGIHVSGNHNKDGGYAAIIPREIILKHLRHDREQLTLIQMYAPTHTNGGSPTLITSGVQPFIGLLEKGPHQATRSGLIRSPLFDKVIEHVTEPSVLSSSDPRLESEYSPLEKGFNKYAIPCADIPPKIRDLIHSYDEYYDIKNMPPASCDVSMTSWDLVLQGRPTADTNNVLYGPMNLSSSPGYPWTQYQQGRPGKLAFIDNSTDTWFICNDLLKKDIRARISHWQRGLSYPSPWTGQLKDEKRKIQKVKDGETRLFTSGTISYQIVARALTIHWVAAVHQAKLAKNSYSRVGVDLFSYDATDLINKHLEVGDQVIAGDHSDFDGMLSTAFTVDTYREIAAWYSFYARSSYIYIPTFDENLKPTTIAVTHQNFANMLYLCGSETWSTTLLLGKNLFLKMGGNTSGNNLTVYLNNKVNRKYMQLCWHHFCQESGKFEWLTFFDEMTRLSVYGDDLLISVAPDALELGFNFQYIQSTLARYRLKFTAADKSENPPPYEPLLHSSFLKCNFKRDDVYPELIRPLIAKDTINELINWVLRSKWTTPEQAMMENLDTALRYITYYGKEEFNNYYTAINSSLKELNIPPMHNIYHSELYRFYHKCGKSMTAMPTADIVKIL